MQREAERGSGRARPFSMPHDWCLHRKMIELATAAAHPALAPPHKGSSASRCDSAGAP